MVKVRHSEEVATHTDPESCAGYCREAAREALTGGRTGEVLSGESNVVGVSMPSWHAEGNRHRSVIARTLATPRRH
jgi:hypothetical protein